MAWSLLEEIGVAYAGPPGGADYYDRPGAGLSYPVYAARTSTGTTVIVDELAIHKALPLRAEYRTHWLGLDGGPLGGPSEAVLADGLGFPAGPSLAVLRVARWELVIVSPAGGTVATIDLSPLSKRMPLVASWTPQSTFLIAFADRLFDAELVEVDGRGRLLWYLAPGPDWLGFPASVQLLPNGNVLVADEYCHVVSEVGRDGRVVSQVGSWRDPGSRGHRLSSPRSAWEGAGGRRLVADTRNDRVLEVTGGGLRVLPSPVDGLSSPTFAATTAGGNLLVCDAGNRRVVEYDAAGEVVWQYGERPPGRRWFSFPRSVQPLEDGGLLVCDTAHDRVAVAANGACAEWPVADGAPLFWPRCARLTPAGTLLVADGRNSRVLEVARSGEVLRRLDEIRLEPTRPLGDPHDVWSLPSGNLLLTDPSLGVVETDWNGVVHRTIGGDEGTVQLDDPHSAQLLENGVVVICDSGNDRVIWVGTDGAVVAELRALRSERSWFRLSRPRHAEVSAAGVLVVADTGNNRVLGATRSGELLWQLDSVPGSPLPWLNQPRWAHLSGPDELIVCDHCHHRILRLRYSAA